MKPIIFKPNELEKAWEVLREKMAEEKYEYLSLMYMVLLKEYWVCFKIPNKFLEKVPLKIHGVL